MYMRYQFSNPSQHSKARKNIPAKKHPWLSYIFVHRMYAIGRPVNLHRPRFRSDLNFLFRPKTCRYVGMRLLLVMIGWCILFVLCWPLALVLIVFFPLIWLVLLPFRIAGFTLDLLFRVIGAILMAPFRLFR